MKRVFIICIFTLLFLVTSVNAESDVAKFYKCVDGDTAKFKINEKIYTVRFLAIDTPETKHPKKGKEPFGKEASKYTCQSLKKSDLIEIEYDSHATKEDKYGRRLAWVFVDNSLLQEKLIEKGYAKVAYLYGDYKYTDRLKKAEKKAKKERLGIWGSSYNDIEEDIVDDFFDKIIRYLKKKIKSML